MNIQLKLQPLMKLMIIMCCGEGGDFHYLPPSRYHGALASVTNIQFAEDLLILTGLSKVHISWELIAAYGVRLLIEC